MNYPVVDHHRLRPATRGGPLRLRGRRRKDDEVPRVDAHHVLVYRVDGDYVLDDSRLSLDDDQVVNATHLTVVDVRHATAVVVSLSLPSAEDGEFTARATFLCTVTDPVEVVRKGVTDVDAILTGYLKKHQRLFELGMQRRMSDINQVRQDVSAQLTAYTELKPLPPVPGMEIEWAGVEVSLPADLVEFQRKRRDQSRENEILTDQQRNDHQRERTEQEHDQRQQAKRQEFERDASKALMSLVEGDPLRALAIAAATGHLDASEFVARLQAAKEQERALEQANLDRKWEEQRQQRAERREDTLRHEDDAREERRRTQRYQAEIFRDLIQRGVADTRFNSLDDLFAKLINDPDLALPQQPSVPAALDGKRESTPSRDHDAEVREEDDD